MIFNLYKCQQETVDKAVTILKLYGGVQFDADMGTGKTRMSLYITKRLLLDNDIDRTVILCPKSLTLNWGRTVRKFLPSVQVIIFNSVKATTKKWSDMFDSVNKTEHPVFIINIESFQASAKGKILYNKIQSFCTDHKYITILDESSKIKTKPRTPRARSGSYRSYNIVETFRRSRYKIGLTGTLIGKSIFDLKNQYDFIRYGFWGMNYYRFTLKYGVFEDIYIRAGRRQKVVVGYQHVHEIINKIKPYTVTLRKKDAFDLPERLYINVMLEMNRDQKKVYKDLKNKMYTEYKGQTLTITHKHVLFMRFRQVTNGYMPDTNEQIGKGNVKRDFIIEDTEGYPGKVTVWDCSVPGIEGWKTVDKTNLYYGRTKEADRELALKNFEHSPESKYLIINPQAGAYGLNLQFSSLAYFVNRSLSAEQNQQAEGRNHRIGSKNKVVYKDLICAGTVDERINKIINRDKDLLYNFQRGSLKDFFDLI